MVDNSNIEKLAESVFPGKLIFGSNLGKKDPEWAQNRVLGIFKKFCHASFSWK